MAAVERIRPEWPTWPTAKHTDAAMDVFDDALTAIDNLAEGHYSHLVESDQPRDDGYWLSEGVPLPTYEDLGVLAVFTDRLRKEVDELRKWIEELEEALRYAHLNGVAGG
jgi:hypothetical protein